VSRVLAVRASNVIKFGIVGLVGVVVNSVSLFLLYRGVHLSLPLAAVASYEMAVVTNFLLDERWTFGYRSLSWARFGKFNLTALGGLVMTASLLWFLVTWIGMQYLLANAVALGAAGLMNLLLSLFWIWGSDQ
jgi:putative flippase GtrA